jgi:hypothetical protein
LALELLNRIAVWGGPRAGPPRFGDQAVVELCIHAANLLYLASFLGRDVLTLRALTCAGLALGLVFFTCRPEPLYGPAFWHVTFLVINAVQIARIVRERREAEALAPNVCTIPSCAA